MRTRQLFSKIKMKNMRQIIYVRCAGPSNKGIVLIEALLAVIILSVSLTVILSSLTSALYASHLARDYFDAQIAVENNLFVVLTQWPNIPETQEKLSTGLLESQFKTEILVMPAQTINLTPSLAEVEVSWQSGRKNNRLAVETFIPNASQRNNNPIAPSIIN